MSKEILPGIWNMSSLEGSACSPCCAHRLFEGLQQHSKVQSSSFGWGSLENAVLTVTEPKPAKRAVGMLLTVP